MLPQQISARSSSLIFCSLPRSLNLAILAMRLMSAKTNCFGRVAYILQLFISKAPLISQKLIFIARVFFCYEPARSGKPTSPAFQVFNYQVPEVPSIQVPMAKDRRLELPAPHNTVSLNGTVAVVAAIEPTGPKTTHNKPVFAFN